MMLELRLGKEVSLLEVSLFQGFNNDVRTAFGKRSVLIREVSLFQGFNNDVRTAFGERKVSLLERCP